MSKKKLNNVNVWLTGEPFELGDHLFEIEPFIPPAIYYQKGIPEFDAFFSHENYIAKGYVCHLLSYENGISIFLAKHYHGETVDFGVAHIERKYIITADYEMVDDLLFPKGQKAKREALRNWSRLGGIIGVIGNEIIEAIDFKVQTKNAKGVRFNCMYQNNMGEEKKFSLYTTVQYADYIGSFLILHYKPVLDEIAKKTIEESDGNCFIATACYKSKYSDEVLLFKRFRNEYLMNYFIGRMFVKVYYFTSPLMLSVFGHNELILKFIKKILDRIYDNLKAIYSKDKK
jgi:hypothetical protein